MSLAHKQVNYLIHTYSVRKQILCHTKDRGTFIWQDNLVHMVWRNMYELPCQKTSMYMQRPKVKMIAIDNYVINIIIKMTLTW